MIAARSPIVCLGVQAASPIALVVGLYLLFAGHNRPGGGFAAGLVFGAVITLRTLAGLQKPRFATQIISVGSLIVAAVAVAPLLWGDPMLDQKVVETSIPIFGKVKSGSALPFDIGVTAIVVGLILALLDGLSVDTLLQNRGSDDGGTSGSDEVAPA